RSMTGTLTSGPAESGSDGWYIKYQEPNRNRFGELGRRRSDSRPLAGAASARLARAGSRSALAGVWRGPGAWCRRRALATLRPRPPADAATEGCTLLAASAGHATPASAPRTPLRKAARCWRRALATLRPRPPHRRRYGN